MLCLADAIHNFKWVKISSYCTNWIGSYANLVSLMLISALKDLVRDRILVQVTINRRLLIGRDGHLDQSEYDLS